MKRLIWLFCISLLIFGCGMSKLKNANTSRLNAKKVIEKADLKNNVKDKSYLLFSLKDKWYCIIINDGDVLRKYSAIVDNDQKVKIYSQGPIEDPKKFLIDSFDPATYHKKYIDLNSKFYASGYQVSDGNPTYFYFSDKHGNIYGESKLTTIINPNPLNTDMYNFLLQNVLSTATSND